MANGCEDAKHLVSDGSSCPLAELIAEWGASGHGERQFQKTHGQIQERLYF